MDLNTITAVERPTSREALRVWRDGDAFLAGGTWLFSEPQPKLTRLIDLSTLNWEPLRATGNGLEIAATCTIAQLDGFAAPPGWIAAPLIGQCCRAFLASFKIWNVATVGGNIVMSLPAGPMISLTCALDGELLIWGPDGRERRVAVVDFVKGPVSNDLKSGEIVRAIHLPLAALTRRTAFRQISLQSHGRSGALLIGTRDAGGAFMLTVTASTPKPYQFRFDALPGADELTARTDTTIANNWFDDIHGLPAWRRAMTLQFAREILAELGGGAA
ncbi:FAD-binding molybdopterin dehydrogenase [Pseudolabrys sp. Root1462]|uniref:FAD binding domain-containing protein n=1 Tax=Pseudolabrys sp. Root1462 TaxID=1736466 RepID=UPI000702D578|nr:FAD binding domain-containing protein [Pseudolabrys sp. Root1462]KQY97508.1 FAD-binding molybdopterin dehydrogenase [Pseudolabrys sp. Root1462]